MSAVVRRKGQGMSESTEQSSTEQSSTEQSSTEQSSTEQSSTEQSSTEQPATGSDGATSAGPAVAEKTVFVLYGATGDLAHRLVLPALFRLAKDGLLPTDWRLVGNGRGDVSHEDFRKRVHDSLAEFGAAPEGPVWDDFASKLLFAGGGFSKDDPGSLLTVLEDAHAQLGEHGEMIHYLAIPPSAFERITQGIGEHGLSSHARIVYEKPFGTSMQEFRELNELAHTVFDESDVYRIDHFLGKEGAQAIQAVRAGNTLVAAAWCRDFIDSVQIDVPETLDIGTRAQFYDGTGAFLDMIVTHLIQLAAQVAMEPAGSDPEEIARAREQVIAAFRPMQPAEVVLGQYDDYGQAPGVAAGSQTDTFVAARLWVDNERWQGVPFLLRTGKALARSAQRVSIVFRRPADAPEGTPARGSVLTFDLAGDGGVSLSLVGKQTGPGEEVTVGEADLPLPQTFGGASLPAYSRLVHDVLRGDRALFTRPEGLSHVWTTVGRVLADRPAVQSYPRGSWGPAEAAALAGPEGWILGS